MEKTLEKVNDWTASAKAVGFPYESDCIHSNMFSLSMNTTDEQNKKISDFIKSFIENKRFMMALGPEVSYKLNRNLGFRPTEKKFFNSTLESKQLKIIYYLQEGGMCRLVV